MIRISLISEKQRIPAYTDRILYLPGRVNDIQIFSYDSYPSITLSDHKPVASTLTMKIYTILKEKRDKMQNELLRELDGLENEALPDLKITPEGIEFNFLNTSSEDETANTNLVINGGELVGSSIELTNPKKFLVAWQLVPKNGESSVCEDWLKISQLSGNLSAGQFLIHLLLLLFEKEAVWVGCEGRTCWFGPLCLFR
jgi:phosphatidylinositol-bisphosphatase